MFVVKLVAVSYIFIIILYSLYLKIFENNFDEYWELYKERYLKITFIASLCCLASSVTYVMIDFFFDTMEVIQHWYFSL